LSAASLSSLSAVQPPQSSPSAFTSASGARPIPVGVLSSIGACPDLVGALIPVLLFTDRCPLVIEAPHQSWNGDPDRVGTAHYCLKSFNCNTYGSPRKCCKQKTYGLAKPFRCNTYKKHGGPFRRSDVPTCRRWQVWHPGTSQDIMSPAIPPPRIQNDAPCLA